MAAERTYLAFDLGASSGRAIVGRFDGERLTLQERHRFANGPLEMNGRLYWNAPGLFEALKAGLAKCAADRPDSLGIDTWGVDFGIVSEANALVTLPVHYRDSRTDDMMELADSMVGAGRIYGETGIAHLKFNTLYQLLAAKRAGELPERGNLLFMPDLLGWMLSGERGCEHTIASTSQMLSAQTGTWDTALLRDLGIPTDLLLPVTPAGTLRGSVSAAVGSACGIGAVKLVAVAGHDTASAVAAVPAESADYAYISSGTWSLMGILSPKPLISPESQAFNYTNEGGADGSFRVLKNIMGLWIIQECLRHWQAKEPELNFVKLVQLAEAEPALQRFIDPDDELFFAPGDMPARIAQYCAQSGQSTPQSIGATVRCVLESLALKYRWSMNGIIRLSGKRPQRLHIVGGGCQNRMLNRFTASALAMPVVCGPVEATAIGNLLMQAKALGDLKSFDDIRAVVRASFELEEVLPQDTAQWDDAYGRFLAVTGLKDA